MAESAFGINHGDDVEFAKFGISQLKPVGQAAKGFKTGFKAKGNDFTPMKPNRTKGFQGGARAGAFTERNKTTIAAGGAGAGVAGTSMSLNNNYKNRQQQGR